MKLDSKNQQIVELLQVNARLSASEIGRTVALSRTAVQDRIKKLEDNGVIRGYRLDLDDTGNVNALIFVELADHPCEPALTWLIAQKGVQEVLSLSGQWDAVIRISVGSANELSGINDLINESEYIRKSISQVVLISLTKSSA